jgi:hypothetical protein
MAKCPPFINTRSVQKPVDLSGMTLVKAVLPLAITLSGWVNVFAGDPLGHPE